MPLDLIQLENVARNYFKQIEIQNVLFKQKNQHWPLILDN